jgi:hypothetical protein
MDDGMADDEHRPRWLVDPIPKEASMPAHTNFGGRFDVARRSAIVLAAASVGALSAMPAVAAASIAVAAMGTPSGSVAVAHSSAKSSHADSDNAAQTGFNATCFTSNVDATYGQASCTLLEIPVGRQVVIETVSCQAEVATGQGPGDVQLVLPNVPLGGGAPVNTSHMLTLTRQAGDASLEIWRTTTSLRAYAASPATGSTSIGIFFRSTYSPSVPVGMVCSISGYMVER